MTTESPWGQLASALTRIAIIMEKRFAKEYPERVVNEPTITEAKYPKPLRHEEEPDPDKTWIGPRETKALARAEKQARRGS